MLVVSKITHIKDSEHICCIKYYYDDPCEMRSLYRDPALC